MNDQVVAQGLLDIRPNKTIPSGMGYVKAFPRFLAQSTGCSFFVFEEHFVQFSNGALWPLLFIRSLLFLASPDDTVFPTFTTRSVGI